ncbi:FAD-dependent oxidoreductase [Streptomyces sp. NBC_00237]|uniref:NAD(P)/FAD-dependent oxidoreductase n=1 Tax=Streptomyces sp. NBC_00237 TaxID=2975687 RepID=UPI00224ED297|nr:FAD-dependent oxidoreductase [Streptomyces sp. NBC_00237]MCX5199924.1 FAD-dependent oxidoreductase [Streptomyces sp. NBC_00237]
MNTHTQQQRVLVVGAGYSGLMAALRLSPHAHVTLLDPVGHLTERIRLHEVAAGRPESEVTHPLTARFLRHTRITHHTGLAVALDPVARTVTTDSGQVMPYDRLVYALGSTTRLPAAHHERLFTAETAPALHKRLLDGPGRLTVVGGGLTGVEMAAELAERHGGGWEVRLLTSDELAPSVSDKGRAHLRKSLRALGVRVEEGTRVDDPADVDADAVLWSASMAANTGLAVAAGLALNSHGRIDVDAARRSVSYPEIYVAGDAGGTQRMSCQAALPLGTRVAASIVSEGRGRGPVARPISYVLQCVSLGRHDGLVQSVRRDDSPRRLVITGRAAAFVKEQICASTVTSLTLAARRAGLHRSP